MSLPICNIFGYGSLMYPDGINGRGMDYVYDWEDLVSCELVHYERGLYASYNDISYYGLLSRPLAITNGVLLPIFSKKDMDALLINEGAHTKFDNTKSGKMYYLNDVTQFISFANTPWSNNISNIKIVPIFTLVNDPYKIPTCGPSSRYISCVWKGIHPWGENFSNKFLATGGIKPANPIKVWAYLLKRMVSNKKVMKNGSHR